MTIHSFHLTAKIYNYLSVNQGRLVPFEELCIFVYASNNEAEFLNKNFSTEVEYQTCILQSLVLLSDLKLIILDELTDESCLNKSIILMN